MRNWAQQAQAVTDATQPSGRSAATAAEIRLREALHKCSIAAGEYSEHTNRPYRLRTAVCCKLLEEFAALAGPFAGILQTIFEELVCTSYHPSEYYVRIVVYASVAYLAVSFCLVCPAVFCFFNNDTPAIAGELDIQQLVRPSRQLTHGSAPLLCGGVEA